MADLSRRQEEIVNAALEIIAAGGMETLTIKAIADRVGFKDAAVYRHFESKQAILVAIVAQLEKKSLHHLESAPRGAAPLQALQRFFIGRCRLFAANRPLVAVMFSEEMLRQAPEVSRRYAAMMETHRQVLNGLIVAGQRSGEVATLPTDHLFLTIIGALRLLVTRWRLGGYAFDLEQAGTELWTTLAAMLRGSRS